MNTDSLTIGEVREILSHVVVRTKAAGVHCGILSRIGEDDLTLTESRRIWSWQGALSCSEIAVHGITGGKVAVPLPSITLNGWIEIIPTSKGAEECLRKLL
jgi:hypothetical protein